MTNEDLKARLLQKRCPEDDVPLDGVGVVRVRGLTRGEVKEISDGVNAGRDMEPYSLSLALISPAMTEDEAAVMAKVAPFGDIQKLTARINELSGIAQGASKEAYKSLHD
ncbi:hypothetical protein ACIBF5_32610 [Micromonospora sp. NPDC050417]|uniref:hypothetical protein n=1 Tax=Micromonospora sp. NPDC050417 TaxID=3364280 RepID=UPI00379F47B4